MTRPDRVHHRQEAVGAGRDDVLRAGRRRAARPRSAMSSGPPAGRPALIFASWLAVARRPRCRAESRPQPRRRSRSRSRSARWRRRCPPAGPESASPSRAPGPRRRRHRSRPRWTRRPATRLISGRCDAAASGTSSSPQPNAEGERQRDGVPLMTRLPSAVGPGLQRRSRRSATRRSPASASAARATCSSRSSRPR